MLGSLALPLSAFELRDAVRSSRHFDPTRLDRVLRVDETRSCIEVQASASWAAIAARACRDADEFSARWGRAAANVGEAVATNAAGPDGQPMVNHVEGMTLVTPEGDLRRVNRASHAELFALTVGGQGIFGAPYSVTLNLRSLVKAATNALPIAELDLQRTETGGRPLRLLVPPEASEAFVDECRTRSAAWRISILGAEVRRTLPENETVLRWARRDFAEVTLLLEDLDTIGGAVRVVQARQELIDAAIANGGSFQIASTPEATCAQIEVCYPQLRKLLCEKKRLDPSERLVNPWYRHHRGLLWREPCEVRWAN
jgi:FAD/FMN-containing dehydrogenase